MLKLTIFLAAGSTVLTEMVADPPPVDGAQLYLSTLTEAQLSSMTEAELADLLETGNALTGLGSLQGSAGVK